MGLTFFFFFSFFRLLQRRLYWIYYNVTKSSQSLLSEFVVCFVFRTNLKESTLQCKTLNKQLILDGDYEVDGKILLLPIRGKGKANIILGKSASYYVSSWDINIHLSTFIGFLLTFRGLYLMKLVFFPVRNCFVLSFW